MRLIESQNSVQIYIIEAENKNKNPITKYNILPPKFLCIKSFEERDGVRGKKEKNMKLVGKEVGSVLEELGSKRILPKCMKKFNEFLKLQ